MITQTNKKNSKLDFAFSIVYSILLIMVSCTLTDTIAYFIQFGISILMYVPILYLLIRFIIKRKTKEYDVSIKGDISDYLLIFSSIIAIISIILIWIYFKVYAIWTTGVQYVIGIPIMIAFIVLSIQNLKTKKALKLQQSNLSDKENKNNIILFIFLLVTFVYVGYFTIMFANVGISYNAVNTQLMVLHSLVNFISQGVLVALSLMIIFILCRKNHKKDFTLSLSNSTIAIGSVISTFVSLVVSSVVFLTGLSKYNPLPVIKYWIITFIAFCVLFIYFVISVIYLTIYIKKNNLIPKNKN